MRRGCILLAGTCSASAQNNSEKKGETDWPVYGNDPGGMRYSSLRQMDAANVAKLRVAWTFHTKDVSDGSNGLKRSGLETTPILVDGTLYLTTAIQSRDRARSRPRATSAGHSIRRWI